MNIYFFYPFFLNLLIGLQYIFYLIRHVVPFSSVEYCSSSKYIMCEPTSWGPSKMSYFVRETYCLLIQYFSQKSLIHSLCLSWNTILLRVVFSKLIDPDETTLTIWTSSGKFCHNFLLSLTINFPPPGRFLAVFVHISN